jgi:predicted RND superfamily exporter protein
MSEPRWMKAVERGLGEGARWCHRRPVSTLAAVAALSAAGFYGSAKLSIDTDLADLLPRSFQSVRDLDRLAKRFGGIGYLVVVGQGGTVESLRRFADEVGPALGKVEGIRFVEHRRATEFFRDRALYYMELDDLKEVHRRLKAREKWERRQRNPLYVKLDEEAPPPLDFSDIEARYRNASQVRLAGNGDSYYLDPQKRMVVLLAKPESASMDLTFSERIVGRVQRFLAGLDLRRYGNDFHVELTGTFKKKIDQRAQILRDVAAASTVATVLMLLYLVLHFRSALGIAYVMIPVGAGLMWTYGLVAVLYGQVNILTAFGGAILGGLGTEHGIHITGRYLGLRAEGAAPEDAAAGALSHSGASALVSALVGALTFASLSLSEFRAFREFGVLAALGMMVVVVACLVTLPALLGLAARLRWRPRGTEAVSGRRSTLAARLPALARPLAAATAVVLVGLVALVPQVRFDYNFDSLQDSTLPSYLLDREVNRILGYSQTPVVVLTDAPGEERPLVRQVKQRKEALGAASTVDFVAALDDLVPEQQEQKQEVLRALEEILDKVDAAKLEGDSQRRFQELRRMAAQRPFGAKDIPESVRRQFQGASEQEGGFVLIFPGVETSDGENVRAIAREVRGLELPSGKKVSASGEVMILNDILEMIYRESFPVLAAAVAMVLAAMWLTLGSLRWALACMAPTAVSILALVGVLPLADFRFNFLNIIAVPVLIGTTVDAGVHLISRLTGDGGAFEPVFAETGRSIIGGLITSAVGFGAMIWADHPGLRSLGELTVLGFSVNLVVMLVGFPAFLLLRRRPGAPPLTPSSPPSPP